MTRISVVAGVVLGTALLGACAGVRPPAGPSTPVERGQATPTPTPVGAGGEMQRGPIFVEETQLHIMESYPIQVALQVKGDLPTPCHTFDHEVEVDEQAGRIDVEAFSLFPADEDLACAQVLQPFDENLRLGSFEGRSYDVYLNGEEVGSFDS